MNWKELQEKMRKEPLSVVDVREKEEFELAHLEGSILLPLSQLPQCYHELAVQQRHYLVCRSGKRSAQAATFLQEKGLDAVSIVGGLETYLEEKISYP